MAIRPVLNGNVLLQTTASNIMIAMQFFQEEEGTDDEQALKNAQKIDDKFKNAWACLERLFNASFREPGSTDRDVQEILRNHEVQISELENINTEADRLIWVDQGSAFLIQQIDEDTHGIIHHLPGVQNGFSTDAVPFSQVLELFIDPHAFTIITPGRALKSLSSLGPRLRSILEGEDAEATRETLKELKAMEKVFVNRTVCLLQRQMWRLEDLRDGGGLGLTVEIFFFVLRQLLSTSSSQESQSSLYVGTFRAITSDWRKYKHSLGTQKILLDAVASDNGIFSHNYPTYITDEFLVLTGNVLDGQTGPHIEEAVQRLREPPRWYHQGTVEFRAKALKVILQSQEALAVPGPPPP
ncbi:hypothetical protein BC826DRAFT_404077 [Russula brevipes]|nr:hypothetical protein BC826DRAFT_404077 [Russula brevipes]